ncbi:MAG: hypothetical protein UZ17_ACD001001347 [Acidobacteria bacterium OLB17]|nr:MAG: hypothetical protein UZ17_ACD001001347 [Acidobacteria bacterium OLB17]MCZ2391740.1 hypothetical protein [Acidobacteriota bacterium]
MSSQDDLTPEEGRLAYTIISSLLEGHEKLSDLLVLMAHSMDEDTLQALTGTPQWEAYLGSKRDLEQTRSQVDDLIEKLKLRENA